MALYRISPRCETVADTFTGTPLPIVKLLPIVIGMGIVAGVLVAPSTVLAQTPPMRIPYSSYLQSGGNAVTTETKIRFSYWKNTDKLTGDVTATGAINIGALNYAGWTEEHTVTPNAMGFFSVNLGSVTPLPDFAAMPAETLFSLHIQVEVKAAALPDTSYEIMDRDPGDDAIDRSQVRSMMIAAFGSHTNRESFGSGKGAIPLLLSGGLLGKFAIPSGTFQSKFTIDADGSENNAITLGFGTSLGRALTFDIPAGRFTFNDDVHVAAGISASGGLTVAGRATFMGPAGNELLRLRDATNNTSVGFYTGVGDPSIAAGIASLYFNSSSGKIYRKSGASNADWTELATASGGALHMAKMVRNVAQTIPDAELTKIAFDAEEFDYGGIADPILNDRFTVAKTGIYMVTASWRTPSVIDLGEEVAVHIYRNGVSIKKNQIFGVITLNAPYTVEVTDVVHLEQGDTLEMYVYQNELSSLSTETDAVGKPRMSVVEAGGNAQAQTERVVIQNLHPHYPNAAYTADGSNNVGQLSVLGDVSGKNAYAWASTRSTLQDYDINLRITLPPTFQGWKDNPLALAYRSTSASTLDNAMDISVFDTAGNPVTLSGSVAGLASTSWVKTEVEFTGAPAWAPGGDVLVRIRLFAKDLQQMFLGGLRVQYTELSE